MSVPPRLQVMLFNSFQFFILLAVTLALYYVPFFRRGSRLWQVTVLLIASAIFYGWDNPRLLYLLGFSCVLNAIAVERIIFWKSRDGREVARRWMTGAVIVNLALLAFFKYAAFICGLVPGMNPQVIAWLRGIPLPVGISFYTFHGVSLVVDVWRNNLNAAEEATLSGRGRGRVMSMRDISFYMVFFPQLIAGPIVKAHQFIGQIGGKIWRDIDWLAVRRYLIPGYFLKIFVADNLAEQTGLLTIPVSDLVTSGPVGLISMLYGYSLQIFADFAGYSLIALGLATLFGYRLPRNFNFPYLSLSVTEFWRRWHISLSSWLRDYLYIPLGGNRKGEARTYLNLFLVMFLGGLWHGAEWKFALWGMLHGTLLAIERFFFRKQGENASPGLLGSLVRWGYTFHVVTLLWLTFLMPDMAHISAFFQGLRGGTHGVPGQPVFALAVYGGAVVLYHLWGLLQERKPVRAAWLVNAWSEGAVHALMLFLIITNPGAPRGFIYFQF